MFIKKNRGAKFSSGVLGRMEPAAGRPSSSTSGNLDIVGWGGVEGGDCSVGE